MVTTSHNTPPVVTITIPGICHNLPLEGHPRSGEVFRGPSDTLAVRLLLGQTECGQPITMTVAATSWLAEFMFEAGMADRDLLSGRLAQDSAGRAAA